MKSFITTGPVALPSYPPPPRFSILLGMWSLGSGLVGSLGALSLSVRSGLRGTINLVPSAQYIYIYICWAGWVTVPRSVRGVGPYPNSWVGHPCLNEGSEISERSALALKRLFLAKDDTCVRAVLERRGESSSRICVISYSNGSDTSGYRGTSFLVVFLGEMKDSARPRRVSPGSSSCALAGEEPAPTYIELASAGSTELFLFFPKSGLSDWSEQYDKHLRSPDPPGDPRQSPSSSDCPPHYR